MNDLQTLQQMIEEYRDLPYDQSRLAMNQRALALAEGLALSVYRTEVRYDLIWAYAVGDDPAKALPVCAEFLALLGEYPGVLRPEGTRRYAISAAMVAVHMTRRNWHSGSAIRRRPSGNGSTSATTATILQKNLPMPAYVRDKPVVHPDI